LRIDAGLAQLAQRGVSPAVIRAWLLRAVRS